MTDQRPFAFYAHHHGRGHLARVAAVCRELGPERCTVATSHPEASDALPPGADVCSLPTDVPSGPTGDVTAGGALHWAPEHEVGAARVHAITGWLLDRRPSVALVDASVEVALTVRLAGVPVVVVRLHGDRTDAPHDLAHRLARSIVAPFPAELEHPSTPAWVRVKTVHSGFVTPAPRSTGPDRAPGVQGRVLVVWGQGHPPPPAGALDAAAAATPGRTWEMVGPPCPDGVLERVRHHGWVDDVAACIATADIVIGPPGDGLVGDVAGAGARFVAVCEPRPFDEHRYKAEALGAAGAAIVLDRWPEPGAWRAVLQHADELDPGVLPSLGTDGAARIAAHLGDVAAGHRGRAA